MTRGAHDLSLTPPDKPLPKQTARRRRERLRSLGPIRLSREQQLALIEEARAARLQHQQEPTGSGHP